MGFSLEQQERINKIRDCIQNISASIEEIRRWQIEISRRPQTAERDGMHASGDLMVDRFKEEILVYYKELGDVYYEAVPPEPIEVLPTGLKKHDRRREETIGASGDRSTDSYLPRNRTSMVEGKVRSNGTS